MPGGLGSRQHTVLTHESEQQYVLLVLLFFTWKCERSDPGRTFRNRLSTRCTRFAGRSSAARPPSSDSGAVSTVATVAAPAAADAAVSPSDSTCIEHILR